MTKIVIAGDAKLPDNIREGDRLRITATVYVHATTVDMIDVSRLGAPPESLHGELQVETVAIGFLEGERVAQSE